MHLEIPRLPKVKCQVLLPASTDAPQTQESGPFSLNFHPLHLTFQIIFVRMQEKGGMGGFEKQKLE